MEKEDLDLLSLFIDFGLFIVTGICAYIFYRVKQLEADIKEARDKARAAPDEDKVRKIVSEEIKNVEKSVDEIKRDMNQMAQNVLSSIRNLDNRINELMMHMISNKRE